MKVLRGIIKEERGKVRVSKGKKKVKLISLKTAQPIRSIPERFISIALDTSQIIGGFWWDESSKVKNGLGDAKVEPLDLQHERLLMYAKLLNPRVIRFGGTEADRVFYSVRKKDEKRELSEGYHYSLDRKLLKEMERFCSEAGSSVMFTVNAGPGPRKDKDRWRKKNARQLIRYSEEKDLDISVWELGNEVNAYPFFLGLSNRLSISEYAEDMRRLKSLSSQSMSAGPALAVWPVLGETLPFLRRFLKTSVHPPDIITWHYYPQQSSRCPVAIRRAGKKTLLKPSNLDEAARQARHIRKLRDRYRPGTLLWLGETGHALCGGEKGLSDTFYSGFWWLDQLCIMAREGMDQVVRQTLTGGDYGLLDKETYDPLPDYWTTLLFNRYVGTEVYNTQKDSSNRKLRTYIHSLKGESGGYCIIYINVSDKECTCTLDESLPPLKEKILLSAGDMYSREILMNNRPLKAEQLPSLPDGLPCEDERTVTLPPISYGFLLTQKGGSK